MIVIELIKALQEQMRFCEREYNYKCGVYITTEANRDIVMKVLNNLYPLVGRKVEIRNNNCESFVKYPNGNMIRVVRANSSARGQRFNGVIIDSNIHQEVIDTIILPCLTPLRLVNGMYSGSDNPRHREYHCYISRDDLVESEKYKQFSPSDSEMIMMLEEQRRMLYNVHFKNGEYIKFEKEYKGMWIGNDYDTPVVEKEVNNDKVLLYEAWGIPKHMISYETEFINKTKQTYLNIKGEYKSEVIGFENDINVHLRIDTDIYDGYEVHIEDGLITVILHEIKNEAPVLKDYGVAENVEEPVF